MNIRCPHCNTEYLDNNYIGIARCQNCKRPFSIHHSEGRYLLENGQIEDALEQLLRASRHMKRTALVFLDLARAYDLLDQKENMNNAIKRAIEIDPDFVREQNLHYHFLINPDFFVDTPKEPT